MFWGLTLKQFAMLAEQYNQQIKREDRRAGSVIAALYNVYTRSKETDPIHDWQDFFTEWKENTEQTEEEMYQTMMMWTQVKPLPS